MARHRAWTGGVGIAWAVLMALAPMESRGDGAPDPAEFAVTPRASVDPDEHQHWECTVLETAESERGLSAPNLWPGGVVPYAFDGNTTAGMQSAARAAMDEIEAVSAVRFVPRDGEFDYINLRDSNGNSSFIGRIGGEQDVNVVSWGFRFIIVHELLHALGMQHEHQRPDRDAFIVVNLQNVEPGFEHNFFIRAGQMHGPYDFSSVMHYGRCTFSLCGCTESCWTVAVRPEFAAEQTNIGQRSRLSDGDIESIIALYQGGAVRNLTTGELFGTLADAIDAASVGDALLSEPTQFGRRPDYDLSGKGLSIRSEREVRIPGATRFVLADGAAIESALDFGFLLDGEIAVPEGAVAMMGGLDVLFESTGALTVGAAGGALVGAEESLDIRGAIQIGAAGVAEFDSLTALVGATGVIDIGPDGLVSFLSGAATPMRGEVMIHSGARLALADQLTIEAGGAVRFLGEGGEVQASDVVVGGELVAAPASGGVVESATIGGAGAILVGDGASLTLRAESIDALGAVTVGENGRLEMDAAASTFGGGSRLVVGAGSQVALPKAGGAVSIDNIGVKIGSGATIESASPITFGAQSAIRQFEAWSVTTSQGAPQALAVRDVDGDGRQDIVVVSFLDSLVAWYRNNPELTGRFDAARIVDAAASRPVAVAAGDVNGDGALDLVVASQFGNAVLWYENDGQSPPAFAKRTASGGIVRPTIVSTADIDGDGDLDLLSGSSATGVAAWHENIGGSPVAFVYRPLDTLTPGISDMKGVDLDGNGRMDIVGAARSTGLIVYEQIDEEASFAQRTLLTGEGDPVQVAVGDANADGAVDLLVAERGAGRVTLLRGLGAGSATFASQQVATLAAPGAVEFADIDGDGNLDALAASVQTGAVIWVRNNGGLAPEFAGGGVIATLSNARAIAASDLNGDRNTDVVVIDAGLGSVSWLEQRRRAVELGAGAALVSLSEIVSHWSMLLQGGLVEGATLRVAPTGRLRGAGRIIGDLVIDGEASLVQTLVVDGAVQASEGASLDLLDAVVELDGDLSIAIRNASRVRLEGATIIMSGASVHSFEAVSIDQGPAAAPVLQELRLRSGATVDLVDAHPNSPGAGEAVYVESLVIEAGATLRTNGVRLYYGSLSLEGAIDGPEHVARIQACPGDVAGNGVVDGQDLALMLGAWGTSGAASDFNADRVVNGADLGILLGSWGACK